MANGDPLAIGITQAPNNRATSATLLVHNGSAFGDQRMTFWVQRTGSPVGGSAIRGDNFSTGPAGGVTRTGVTGMIQGASGGVGVLGVTAAGPNIFFGEAGVMGITSSFGVVGRSLTGVIIVEQGSFVSGTGVVGQCDTGVGVHGIATSGWGIIGQSVGRAGVTGKSTNGVGVDARSEQSHGVQATSQNGAGVLAESTNNSGVVGKSNSWFGVYGYSDQGIAGVRGDSNSGYGVFGESQQSYGVVGVSTTGIGIGGSSSGGWAGFFEGNVLVSGGLYVLGGPKSAAVPHPDGTHRALFCLESPESYFEDFGEVAFTGESVMVKLDKDFASLVKRNKYQVFLTSYGPEALYVRKRSADGFEIARVDPGAGGRSRNVRVGYRIVARRADLKPARLPKVKISAQPAEAPGADRPTSKGKRKRSNGLMPSVNIERLPEAPRIPSPDLNAIAKEKPARAKPV